VPFFTAGLSSIYLYPRLSDDTVSFTASILFLGAAMSITAFPVLARILTEKNLMGTRLGVLAIACAAVDDVTGWCILAGILAMVQGARSTSPFVTVLLTVVYVAVMVFAVKPLLARIERGLISTVRLSDDALLTTMVCLGLSSALVTDWIGIHPLFGAFVFGAILPRSSGAGALVQKLRPFVEVLLWPPFFAFTGLRTSIGCLRERRCGCIWSSWSLLLSWPRSEAAYRRRA
jgi:Kef-type K+ transport system membrane component KefB